MDYIIILILALSFMFLFRKLKISRVLYLKKLFLPVLAIIFISGLIFFSKTAVTSASRGIQLWLNIVFPSLFPFFVASEILNNTGLVRAAGILLEPVMRPLFNIPGCGSFALAMGITSGYPVGARITSQLKDQDLLSRIEAERLLAFTNNSGPLFIFGAVSVGMFNMPELGPLLYCSHLAACLTVGILFRFYGTKIKHTEIKYTVSPFSRAKMELVKGRSSSADLGSIFGDAIKNSIMLILVIGGFITVFSVIISMLLESGFIGLLTHLLAPLALSAGIDLSLINAVLSGFFEITTGTNLASQPVNIPMIYKLTAVSIIIGWAGLSVHAQVLSIISKSGISIKPYLVGKALQGIISGIYTFIIIKTAGLPSIKVKPAFSPLVKNASLDWYNSLTYSFSVLLLVLLILAVGMLMFKFLFRPKLEV